MILLYWNLEWKNEEVEGIKGGQGRKEKGEREGREGGDPLLSCLVALPTNMLV